MTRTALGLTIVVAISSAACLQKDTTSTIYLRPDGSMDWVVVEQNVHSDASDEAERTGEEARYADAVARGDLGTVNGFLALGGDSIRVRWLRSVRPYAVVVDARFDSLARVFDRLLAPCDIPYESAITESGGVTTWTLVADVGIDGKRLNGGHSDACGQGVGELPVDSLRIVLESGSFTAATGFTLQGTVAAVIDDKTLEEGVETTGLVELSLSWK